MANNKQVRVWDKAHEVIGELAEMLAAEKGLEEVTFVDAVSIAIMEAYGERVAVARGKEVPVEPEFAGS